MPCCRTILKLTLGQIKKIPLILPKFTGETFFSGFLWKNNFKQICVPTLPKIFRSVTRNTLIFIWPNPAFRLVSYPRYSPLVYIVHGFQRFCFVYKLNRHTILALICPVAEQFSNQRYICSGLLSPNIVSYGFPISRECFFCCCFCCCF